MTVCIDTVEIELETTVVEIEPPAATVVEVAVAGGSVVLPESGRRDHVLTHRGRARASQALSIGRVPTTQAPLVLERRSRLTGLTLSVDAVDVVEWRLDVEVDGVVSASLTLGTGQASATVDGLAAQVEIGQNVVVRVINITSTARSRWRAATASLTFAEN